MRLLDSALKIAGLGMALLAASSGAGMAQPGANECPSLVAGLPGVVPDEMRRLVYAAPSGGRLTAFAAANGSVAWRSEARQSPLAKLGERLLVWGRNEAGDLLFTLFDLSAGQPRATKSFTVSVPDWARTQDVDANVTLVLEHCRLWLRWRVDRPYRGGAAPIPGFAETENKKLEGWVTIDPPAEFGISERGPSGPSATSRSAPYRLGLEWRTAPLIVGGKEVMLAREKSAAGERLSLVYRGTKTIDVATGHNLMAMASPDNRYLFAADLAQTDTPAESNWTIVDVATGQTVGKVSLPADLAAATVADGHIYYLREQRLSQGPAEQRRIVLVAADLPSGRTLWQQVLSEQRPQLTPP